MKKIRRLSLFRLILLALALLFSLKTVGLRAQSTPPDDPYLRGYAASILERQFHITPDAITVVDGQLTLWSGQITPAEVEPIKKALEEIPGIHRVEILSEEKAPSELAVASPSRDPAPAYGEILPAGHLFRPLMADQRWPHFSSTFQRYLGDDELKNVGAVSLGATIPLYENDFWDDHGRWSLAVEGVVFSIFDLDAKSKDLVNSDYWVGIPLSYAKNNFSAVARLFHQSSHLGDEYLLRNRVTRIDLNYEAFDLRLSYDLFEKMVRFYGGGGFIFNKNPPTLDPWSFQGGVEFRCPRTLFRYFRPVAGCDLQTREETNWDVDVSCRAGLQLDAERLQGRTLQIMLEYFQGHSPNGQFFERDIEYFGLGVHFYL